MIAAPPLDAQRVEHLVGVGHIGTLRPRRSDVIERFLVVLTDDELGHARALGTLMDSSGEFGPVVERAVSLTLESDPAGEELLARL